MVQMLLMRRAFRNAQLWSKSLRDWSDTRGTIKTLVYYYSFWLSRMAPRVRRSCIAKRCAESGLAEHRVELPLTDTREMYGNIGIPGVDLYGFMMIYVCFDATPERIAVVRAHVVVPRKALLLLRWGCVANYRVPRYSPMIEYDFGMLQGEWINALPKWVLCNFLIHFLSQESMKSHP